jgi:hypothetical protein
MTSVLSSTRQVPLATTFYNAPSSVNYYQLNAPVNGSGNYPGTMTAAAAPTTTDLIARDMGKTVEYNGSFYREIQLLGPQIAAPGAGFGGIVGGGLTSYGVYYVVVPMAGFGSGLPLAGLTPIAGGQM